ncbi:MAG: AsmA family protein [Nitrospira sp.]|nr:AsmA family protein [Nitrospira sp.]MCP9461759.1 AsmA family protein [Nitrospira sp.]MCP9475701.1 AsmA family protein [Nitrospira sp.]
MKVAIGVLTLVAAVAGLALALPFLIDLNKYKDQYKPLIEDALNRTIEIQDVRLTLWPTIGARVTGLSILDDPAFGAGAFASAASLDVGVKLLPLLSGRVEVENVALRGPVVAVIKNKAGVLNVSTLGRKGVPIPDRPSRAPIPSMEGLLKILGMLAADRVSIAGGTLTFRDFSAAKPTEYVLQDLDLLLRSVGIGRTPSLHLDAVAQPFNLPLKLDGTFGPLKETAGIEVINVRLNLGSTHFTVTGSVTGHEGTVHVSAPMVRTTDLPVSIPVKQSIDAADFRVTADVKGQTIEMRDVSFHFFGGRVRGGGKLVVGSEDPPFSGHLAIEGFLVGPIWHAVVDAPPAISGTADVTLALKGRGFSMPSMTKDLEGTGRLAIRDGTIEGINLLREMTTIFNVAGVALGDPKATAFSTIEADLAVEQGMIRVQRLLMDGHDFQATGSGTIGFDRRLSLAVTVSLSRDLSEKIAGVSPVAQLAMRDGRMVLPLVIGGTVQSPSYRLDLKGVTENLHEQIQRKAAQVVDGLLGGTAPDVLKRRGRPLLSEILGRSKP